jgi:hypothetical protein
MSVDGKATLGSATLSYGTMISDGMMGALNTAGTYDPTGFSGLVNTGIRAGVGVDSPGETAVDVGMTALSMVPAGRAGTALPKIGIAAFDLVKDFTKVKPAFFNSYLEQLETRYLREGIAVTRDEAAAIVRTARRRGEYVRIDDGHPGTRWDMKHLNIGPKNGQYHVPIQAKSPRR